LCRHHDRQEYGRKLAAAGAVIYRNNEIGVRALQSCKYTTSYVEKNILQICYYTGKRDIIFCGYGTIQISVTYSADMVQYR